MTNFKTKDEILTTKYHSNGNKGYEESILEVEGELLLCKTFWYEDGQKITESNHKNGEYDGNWTSWHEDGQKVSEGKYINGRKEGKWTEWDESGKITVQENYKDGELID